MRYLIGIPYVTGPEFTEKALASQQQSSNEEMLYDAEDAVVGDVQR